MVVDKTPKVITCSLCPDLRIHFIPGDGTMLNLWIDHKKEVHPVPELIVIDI